VRTWLEQARSVVVLTGAGISTDSGIPDFRGPQGIWTTNPEAQRYFEFDVYMSEPDVRVRAWQMRRGDPVWSARPNAGHRALVDLHRTGRLRMLLTQNVDGLHQRAGTPPERLLELHGGIREVECMGCSRRQPTEAVFARLDDGEDDPPCLECGGILKTATIAFGQNLRQSVLAAAEYSTDAADLFLAIGTSLQVYPAAALPARATRAGARLVVVNAGATPYDDEADAVLRDPISEVLPPLVAGLPAV
jgi:NAD-dependent deacetylase